MILFNSITIRNFLSFGNNDTTIMLNAPGATLILGEDLDNTSNGLGANGVGKTVIVNALAYIMYGKPVSNISQDNLINNINKKNMEVSVLFEANGKSYKIVRVRKGKSSAGSNYIKLFESNDFNFTDEHDITRDSIANTNKAIEQIIGIPYELFVRIVVFSANHTPFLDLSVANQSSIIEELFELTELSHSADLLKEEIKETKIQIAQKEDIIAIFEEANKRHMVRLEKAKARVVAWDAEKVHNIESLIKQRQQLDLVDVKEQQKLHHELLAINTELTQCISESGVLKSTIVQLTNTKKKKEAELDHLHNAKCPYCLQEFAKTKEKILECDEIVLSSTTEIEILSGELIAIDDRKNTLLGDKAKVVEQIVIDNLDDVIGIDRKRELIVSKLADMEIATNPFIVPLAEIEDDKQEPVNYDEIDTLNETLVHQKFLLKLLTKKDSFVRKALLNKNIPFLNSRLYKYLRELGLPHTVEFTQDLSAKITQFDKHLDFGNLSNGQRARVNLALSFAFRDVLQKIHTRINVCLMDEVLDVGLDQVGVQNAAKLLKKKSREEDICLYLISHRSEIDSTFDNTMTVQMVNGFSQIKENA